MIEFDSLKPQYVEEIYRISCEGIPNGWSLEAFKAECAKSDVLYSVAVAEGKPVGFLGLQWVLDEADITNIAVDKNMRNMGIATKLLNNIFEQCAKISVTRINLEVRETNKAAINLYLKTGFLECGVRKRYYSDTGEAALIMVKQI